MIKTGVSYHKVSDIRENREHRPFIGLPPDPCNNKILSILPMSRLSQSRLPHPNEPFHYQELFCDDDESVSLDLNYFFLYDLGFGKN